MNNRIQRLPLLTNGVRAISSNEAKYFLLPRHYSGRTPSISFAYGLYENSILVAVCTFGKPVSNPLCEGICGKEYSPYVYELNRLCRLDDCKTPLSHFVSKCLKFLKPKNLIIVSFSDTAMHHNGYIYQATNFLYTGTSKVRFDMYMEGNKHARHYKKENDKNRHLRKVSTLKHRYVYFTCNKTIKKAYKKALKYLILPYPKGINKNYVLGEYQKVKVINTLDNTYYYE